MRLTKCSCRRGAPTSDVVNDEVEKEKDHPVAN